MNTPQKRKKGVETGEFIYNELIKWSEGLWSVGQTWVVGRELVTVVPCALVFMSVMIGRSASGGVP